MARARFHHAPRCESGSLPQPLIGISYRHQSSLSWRSSKLCPRRDLPAHLGAPFPILFLEACHRYIRVCDIFLCVLSVSCARVSSYLSSLVFLSLSARISLL